MPTEGRFRSFGALRDQLGLMLKAEKTVSDIVVVDSVEKQPRPN